MPWDNDCLGSHLRPRPKRKFDQQHQIWVASGDDVCTVCGKAVRLRKDGTTRSHVNSPVTNKVQREAVTDLIEMKKELDADPS